MVLTWWIVAFLPSEKARMLSETSYFKDILGSVLPGGHFGRSSSCLSQFLSLRLAICVR